MKTLLPFFFSGLMGLTACTPREGHLLPGDVPDVVRSAFHERYPRVKAARWEREDSLSYEANFQLDGIAASATFSAQGDWLEFETDIQAADLPTPVIAALQARYPGHVLKHCEQVRSPTIPQAFELKIDYQGRKMEVVLAPDGTDATEPSAQEQDND